tara:strand:+ start:308 stop:538 length:231 start_codon:yes stop_codon:yes gene_type:complete
MRTKEYWNPFPIICSPDYDDDLKYSAIVYQIWDDLLEDVIDVQQVSADTLPEVLKLIEKEVGYKLTEDNWTLEGVD